MTVKLSASQKAIASLVRDAKKTAKAESTPYASSRTIRVWGTGYVITMINALIEDALPAFTSCGITTRNGSPFINKLPATNEYDLVGVSQVLRFWSRMCGRAKADGCPGTAEDKARIAVLDTAIRLADGRGLRPTDLAQVVAKFTGLPTADAQKVLSIKSVERRRNNEEAVVAECAADGVPDPYEWLSRYDFWWAATDRRQSSPPLVPCDAPRGPQAPSQTGQLSLTGAHA